MSDGNAPKKQELPASRRNVEEARPRPNARWVCGYQSLGMACMEGPDEKGVCCQLKQSRSEANLSGDNCEQNCSCAHQCELACLRGAPELPSHESLGPCTPRKTTWFSRQALALNAAILTGGCLLLCMALPSKEAIFVPGGLSSKHSQILGNRLASERCSMCHPTSQHELAGLSQDELCMNCHQSHMPDAQLRSAHDLNEKQLIRLVANTASKFVSLEQAGHEQGSPTRCASCHIEHHGEDHQLQSISDQRCQACHQTQFESLADGHPSFDDFPYRTERRVKFNHSAHAKKHFGQKNEQFDCRKCHVDFGKSSIAGGSVFRSLGFEQACASCHDASIQSAATNGWAFLQLPSVEPEDVADATRGLSNWPPGAQFGYEGEVSLPMRILLASDTDAASAFTQLTRTDKLTDIPTSSEQRSDATRRIARATQRLVDDIARGGQKAWRSRLEAALSASLQRVPNEHEQSLIEELCSGVPPDLFRTIQRSWFSSTAVLATNTASPTHSIVPTVKATMVSGASPQQNPRHAINSPTFPGSQFLITQQPADLHVEPRDSDRILSGITDALINGGELTAEPSTVRSSPSTPTRNIRHSTGEDRSVNDPPLGSEDELLLGETTTTNDSLLAEDDLGGNALLGDDLLGNGGEEELLSDGLLENDLDGSSDLLSGSSTLGGASQAEAGPIKLTKLRGSEHVVSGGWYLDEELYIVRYMPRGHGDRTIAAWTEFAAILNRTEEASSQVVPNHALDADSLLRNCSDCHRLGTRSDTSQLFGNWMSNRPMSDAKPFTKFDHTPHLTLPAVSDCRYCHVLNSNWPGGEDTLNAQLNRSGQLVSFHGKDNSVAVNDEHEFSTEFASMKLEQCAACHRKGAASDGCTTCHNYHVGTQGFQWSH